MSANNGNGDDGHITIKELLERIDATASGMSSRNPNRVLLVQCRVAIVYLASRMPDESVVTRSGIILP